MQFNSDLVHSKQGDSKINQPMVGSGNCYSNSDRYCWLSKPFKTTRADIRSYVYDELNRDDFKVKIDQRIRSITVVPESSEIVMP